MRIIKKFVLREIGGEAVLVPLGETAREFNGMCSLTETAKTIWKHYEDTESMEDMVQIILDEYDIDEKTAREDVYGFTMELIKHGIIEPSREDRTW